MKRIFPSILLLLLAVSFFQCRKEPSFVGEPDPVPVVITPAPITAGLQGNILDENGQPAAGVAIKVGNKTTITDAKGYFRINDAPLDKKGSLVIAEKNGYFKGIRLFSATSGTNYISVKLIKKILAGTVNSGTGGSVSLANGSKVSLQANGVVIASSGNAYSGTVNVYAQYIDPSASDIKNTVPGSFKAIDKDGKNTTLTSYGMMAVQLESAAGERLQIKEGNTATLTSLIPVSAQASAPASIPLWYVDEQTGLWREEGSASKQGNTYVGTVKHFSFWNCDVAVPCVTLTLNLVNANNEPLVYANVLITRQGGGWQGSGYGYTDSLGNVSGSVPANENLLVEVTDPCGNIVFSQTVTALTQDTDLGTITVSNSTLIVTVKGRLLNCNNMPVTNGYAIISIDNVIRYAVTNSAGEYQTTFVNCLSSSSTAGVTGVDTSNAGQQVSSSAVAITTPVTNVPDLIACGASAFGYINFTIDDTSYSYSELTASDEIYGIVSDWGQGVQGVTIHGYNDNLKNFAVYISANNLPGVFSFLQPQVTVPAAASFQSDVAFPGQQGNSIFVHYFSPDANALTLSNFANNINDYFEGSFSARYNYTINTDLIPAIHNITCSFRVKRRS